MNIPEEAVEAAVKALFDEGCGEPKVDASTALEAAYKFIAAQAWEQGYQAGMEYENHNHQYDNGYESEPVVEPDNPYAEERPMINTHIIGYIVIDKNTRQLDWDGDLHPTASAAMGSIKEADNDKLHPHLSSADYWVCPVHAPVNGEPHE